MRLDKNFGFDCLPLNNPLQVGLESQRETPAPTTHTSVFSLPHSSFWLTPHKVSFAAPMGKSEAPCASTKTSVLIACHTTIRYRSDEIVNAKHLHPQHTRRFLACTAARTGSHRTKSVLQPQWERAKPLTTQKNVGFDCSTHNNPL